jgi:hypothetical protein
MYLQVGVLPGKKEAGNRFHGSVRLDVDREKIKLHFRNEG